MSKFKGVLCPSIRISILLLFSVSMLVLISASAHEAEAQTKSDEARSDVGAILVGEPVRPTISRAVSRLPEYNIPEGPVRDINPRRTKPRRRLLDIDVPRMIDPLIVTQLNFTDRAPNAFTTPILNFDGQGFTFVNPPDTVGDVGPNHYIQAINASGGSVVRVYNKATGSPIGSQFAMDTLGTAQCASGSGDPIVLWDPIADRWLLSEFSSSGNRLCVYISTTPDPFGTYYAYSFQAPNFPDYPKYSVWPDAYYVTSNENNPAAYALDRVKMLAGQAAGFVRFTATDLSGFGFQAMTPADLDGSTPPPPGSPGIFMRHRDTEIHGPAGFPNQDMLEIFALAVDWNTPANSTFTQLPDAFTSESNHLLRAPDTRATGLNLPELFSNEFDSTLCGNTSFFCMGMPGVAQGASSSLDPLREVIMHRLVYRNFGTHEALVGNFVTDVGNNIGGVRWFELRKTGATPWTVYQEGTFAPTTTDNRWMAAIAMDGAGNIALGYNISSGTIFPGLRYTGRLSNDPLGVMTQGDNVLVEGSAINGSNRYGDYSAMSVDPEDDCTFWFTGQYNSSSQWSTRIGKFKFDQCGDPDFTISAAPATLEVCQGNPAVYNVNIGSISGYNSAVTLSTSGNPGTAAFGTNPVIPAGSSTMTISNAAAGSYNFNVVGTASGPNVKQTTAGLTVRAGAPSGPVLSAPTNNALNVAAAPTFTWGAVVGAATYSIEVATDAGFVNIVASASGLTAPTWMSNVSLNTSTAFFWRVRAVNACGNSVFSATFSFTTVAAPGDCGPGTTANIIYQYGFESGSSGWAQGTGGTGNTWAISSSNPRTGSSHYRALNPSTLTDQRLDSPPIVLPTGQNPLVLKFWHEPNLEPNGAVSCYDGGILEFSTNGGSTWTQVSNANLLVGPYRGNISNSWSNPLGGLQGWCGATSYFQTVADVSALAGQTARFRMRLGTDTSVSAPGWDVDDVVVQGCQGGTPPPTPTPTPVVPTPTPTPVVPTPTPTPVVPTPTPTPVVPTPTPTPVVPTPTPTPVVPTPTPTPAVSPTPPLGFEGDIAPRPLGDLILLSNDVTQIRRFVVGTDIPQPGTTEFQRADAAPYLTQGDGVLTAGDTIQIRRYVAGLDIHQPPGGPMAEAFGDESSILDDIYRYFFGREIRVASESSYRKDGRITVPIEMTPLGDESAVSFTLEFDALQFRDPVITMGEAFPDDAVLTVNLNEASTGRIAVLIDSGEAMRSSVETQALLYVTFALEPYGARGEVPLLLSGAIASMGLSDENGNLLPTRFVDGTLFVGDSDMPEVNIEGRVLSPDGRGLRNATVILTGTDGSSSTVTTGTFGTFRFEDAGANTGQTLTVQSRRYTFGSRQISNGDNTSAIVLIGHE